MSFSFYLVYSWPEAPRSAALVQSVPGQALAHFRSALIKPTAHRTAQDNTQPPRHIIRTQLIIAQVLHSCIIGRFDLFGLF